MSIMRSKSTKCISCEEPVLLPGLMRDLLRMKFSLTCLMIHGIDPYIKSEAM